MTDIKITHRMPEGLLMRIDGVRGHVSRNAWMNRVLDRAAQPDKITFTFDKQELEQIILRHAMTTTIEDNNG